MKKTLPETQKKQDPGRGPRRDPDTDPRRDPDTDPRRGQNHKGGRALSDHREDRALSALVQRPACAMLVIAALTIAAVFALSPGKVQRDFGPGGPGRSAGSSESSESSAGFGSRRRAGNIESTGSAGSGTGLFQVTAQAEEGYDQVADSSSMGRINADLVPYGMTPVSGSLIRDGEYIVGTESSSSFFRIEEAKLTVRDGKITALLRMYSSSYLLVYPGKAEEAAAASYEDYILPVDMDGWDTFTVPVEALDMPVDLAAYSKKKKKWYPRRILFHASDIPADSLKFDYPDYDRISAALAAYEETGPGQRTAPTEETENGQFTAPTAGTGPGQPSALPDSDGNDPQAAAMDLADGKYSVEVSLTGALAFMVLGGIINCFVKKSRQ